MTVPRSLMFIVGLALCLSACGRPTAGVAPLLEPQFGTRGNDYAESIAFNEAGYLYVTGRLDASDRSGGDPFLRRYDRAGSLLWEAYLDMTAAIDGSSVTSGVATDSQGNVYTSWSYDVEGVGRQSNLAKYNSRGKLLWSKRLPATAIINLALDRAANLYVVSGPHDSSHLTKYTTSGAQVWQRSVTTPAWYLATSSNRVHLLRLDGHLEHYTLTGRHVGTTQLALDGTRPRGLRLGLDGQFFVLSERSLGAENLDGCASDTYSYVLYAFGRSGAEQWKRTVTTQPTNRCVGLSADVHGNAYVTGSVVITAPGTPMYSWQSTAARVCSGGFGCLVPPDETSAEVWQRMTVARSL